MNKDNPGKATIIIPTLNEVENISDLIKAIFEVKPAHHDYTLVVVDDGSTDGTGETVIDLGKEYPVSLLQRGKRLGLSSAVIDGARKAETDWVMIIDADRSHPPERVPELLEPVFRGEADLVIGSRYIEGGKISGWPIKRQVLSGIGTMIASMIVPCHDPLAGYFVCRREHLLKAGGEATGYKILLELLAALPPGSRVQEIPIHFIERERGQSKLSHLVEIQFFRQFMRLLFNRLFTFADLFRYLMIFLFFDLFLSFTFWRVGGMPVHSAHLWGFILFSIFSCGYYSSHRQRLYLFDSSKLISVWAFLCLLCYMFSWRVAIIEYNGRFNFLSDPWLLLISIGAGGLIFIKACGLGLLIRRTREWGKSSSSEVLLSLQALFLLLFIYAHKLLYLPLLDLIPQEALHWCRAMNLAPAFVDHPGGVAVLISSTIHVLGHSEFAVRIGAFLCGLAATYFVFATARKLSNRSSTGLIAAAIFNISPFFWGTGYFVFPDSPLIAACSATIYFYLRAFEDDAPLTYWILGGISLGIAVFSKYTAGYLGLSICLFLLLTVKGRRKIITKFPFLSLLSILLTLSPLLIFEYSRDWMTFRYQFLRRMAHGFWALPDYIGVMMAELSPVLMVLFLVIIIIFIKDWSKLTDKEKWLLLCSVPLLTAYAIYSNWNRVKFSWPAPAFIPLFPLAVHYMQKYPQRLRGLRLHTLWSLLLFYCLILLLLATPLTIAYNHYPLNIMKNTFVWQGLGNELNALRTTIEEKTGRDTFVIGMDKYYLAAESSYYLKELPSITSRNAIGKDGLTWNEWAQLDSVRGRTAILLAHAAKDLDLQDLKIHFAHLSDTKALVIQSGIQIAVSAQ